jgi:hypothetical protein
MNRSQSLVFRLLIAALAAAFLGSVTASLQAQTPPAPPAAAAKAAPAAEEEEDPFAIQPATPLPPDYQRSARRVEARALRCR